MQGFNKLAGVQDAPRHIATGDLESGYPEPPPIPETDNDEYQTRSLRSHRSRASIPNNIHAPRRTFDNTTSPPQSSHSRVPTQTVYTASRNSAEGSFLDGEDQGELEWGPQHPCYPHPNTHAPLDSPTWLSTRIIRVQRDWLVAGDLYPAIQNLYPEILADYITEAEFRSIVESLNKLLKETFNPWQGSSCFDATLGVLTGFLWDNTGLTSTKRSMTRLEHWIDAWNIDAERQGQEARLIQLRRTGFLTLDIQIPDPQIDGT